MSGQELVFELKAAAPLKRKGFITFLHRARGKILRAHDKKEIGRYQEGTLLMLRKRSYPETDGKHYHTSAMELAFSDVTDQMPQISDAIWYLNYAGHALMDEDLLRNMEPKERSRLIRRTESFLVATMLANDDPAMFRGPEMYETGDWTYVCTQHGDFVKCRGEETVFFRDMAIYRGTYLGQIRT